MCVVLRIILNKELIMYPERMNSFNSMEMREVAG